MLSVPEKILFAVILTASGVYFTYRTWILVSLLRMSRPEIQNHFDHLPARGISVILDVIGQRRLFSKPVVALLHLFIVWGFIIFIVNTIDHFTGGFVEGFHLLGHSRFAMYYYSIQDVFAVLVITGVIGLTIRRYVIRPESLTQKSIESMIVLAFIGLAMVAYLWLTAAEIATGAIADPTHHFVSLSIASLMPGSTHHGLQTQVHIAWWSSVIMHLILIALLVIPTKHMHLVAGPINLLLKRRTPRGWMSKMDLEDEQAETFGISKIQEFTWKQNLDLYSCIECGRCQDFCPTHNSGKPLSPKKLIVDLKDYLLAHGPKLLKTKSDCDQSPRMPALIDDTITKDTIWACTTCAACVELCPMGIEHFEKITDMRRYLTLTEGDISEPAALAFKNMETSSNPWALPVADRVKWSRGLDVAVLADKKQTDILFWVGCSGSYDDRNQKITVAMTKILNAAGVDFAILGTEERCTCESARRLGNEYLFQNAAMEIVETLKQYSFNRILTICPHCFNTFSNEFSDFGGDYQVIHHTVFINELIGAGKLKLNDTQPKTDVVFHDSCYLGRYASIYQAPRDALKAAGCRLKKVDRQKEKAFCCGAGGGRMWLEEDIGDKINNIRTEELLGAGASTIAAACPFCMTMLTDAVNAQDRSDVLVKDIAEIVADSLKTNTISNDERKAVD